MDCDYSNIDKWCYYVPQCELRGGWNDNNSSHDTPYLYNPQDPNPDLNEVWCRNALYCEDFLSIPEIGSAITAIVISFMAIYQLSWDHPIEIIRCLSGFIFMNGICSFINHWTGALVFSYLDNATMYLPLYIMTGIVAAKYVRRHGGPIYVGYTHNFYIRFLIRAFVWILCTGFIIILLFNDWTLSPKEILFVAAFGIPLLVIAIMAYVVIKTKAMEELITRHYKTPQLIDGSGDDSDDHSDEKEMDELELKDLPVGLQKANTIAVKLFQRGVFVCIGFGALWLITEPICTGIEGAQWLKYFFTHSLWHIGMSYGLSLIMLYYTFIECSLRGHIVYYARGSEIFCTKFKKCDCCCKQNTIKKLIKDHSLNDDQFCLFPILFVKNPQYDVSQEIAHEMKNV